MWHKMEKREGDIALLTTTNRLSDEFIGRLDRGSEAGIVFTDFPLSPLLYIFFRAFLFTQEADLFWALIF